MDNDLITQWQRGTMPERIAADLAAQIQAGKLAQHDNAPLNRTLAGRWGVSDRTVSSAKRLLARHRMLTKVNNRYYVA